MQRSVLCCKKSTHTGIRFRMKLLTLLMLLPLSATAAPDTARQQELTRFVRQECGFCHGLHLTGGLGSPLTATALRDKPAESIAAAIRFGMPGTAMPGWAPFLDDADTQWIVEKLQQGFPK